MPRIWLPIGPEPRGAPRDERDELLRRLRAIGVHVAGAAEVEISQLREIVHWQEEKAAREAKLDLLRPQPRFTKEEIARALRDVRDFRNARKEGRRRLY